MLAKVWAPFFFFSVLIPFALFAETSEPSTSFLVGAMMSSFAPLLQLPILTQLVVRWGQIRVEGLVLLPKLVTELVVVVSVSVQWVQLVPILLPAILPVALVSGHVLASVPPTRFPNSGVETTPTTIGQ